MVTEALTELVLDPVWKLPWHTGLRGWGGRQRTAEGVHEGKREEQAVCNSFHSMGAPNIFSTTSTCHCPFAPLPLMPMSDPRISLKKDALQCKYTPQSYTNIYTYTNALWEPTATSAVIPPDFRCLTGRRQGG